MYPNKAMSTPMKQGHLAWISESHLQQELSPNDQTPPISFIEKAPNTMPVTLPVSWYMDASYLYNVQDAV